MANEQSGGYFDAFGNWIADAYNNVTGAVGDAVDAIRGISDDNQLSQSKYDFKYRSFPSDLGMDYMGHYMVININVPTEFLHPNQAATNLNEGNRFFTVLPDEMSKVDVLRFSDAGKFGNADQSDSLTGRRTRRIVESIALYMPGSQLIYNSMNAYEEVSMTAIGGQIATGAFQTAGIVAGYFFGGPIGSGAAGALGEGAAGIVSKGIDAASMTAKLAGRPINPRVEVLFTMTALRDFQFEFLMTPRNEEEARAIQGIVKTLRYHAAPELMSAGFQFIPPAEFDITFYHRGVETDKLPRINTCVLARLEVDYAPGTGMFSTFKDGQPVATRIMMVFKEVEIIHKLRIAQGF